MVRVFRGGIEDGKIHVWLLPQVMPLQTKINSMVADPKNNPTWVHTPESPKVLTGASNRPRWG